MDSVAIFLLHQSDIQVIRVAASADEKRKEVLLDDERPGADLSDEAVIVVGDLAAPRFGRTDEVRALLAETNPLAGSGSRLLLEIPGDDFPVPQFSRLKILQDIALFTEPAADLAPGVLASRAPDKKEPKDPVNTFSHDLPAPFCSLQLSRHRTLKLAR